MTRFFMGNKSGYGPLLRILKNNADDPLTTPSTDFGKFIYDSTAQKLTYVYDIRTVLWDTSTYPIPGSVPATNYFFTPPGSNIDTCDWVVMTKNGGQFDNSMLFKYFIDYYPELGRFPLVEVRFATSTTSSIFQGPSSNHRFTYDGGSIETGYIYSTAGYETSISFFMRPLVAPISRLGVDVGLTSATANRKALVTTLELPAGDEPMFNWAGTPVPGQEALRLSNTMARMAYPGHDVTEDTVHIFSEDRSPAKILACGEVTVATGTTVTIDTILPTTPTTYMDYIVRRDVTDLYHPPYPQQNFDADSISFTYEILAQGVLVTNTCGFNLVIRYIIYANDASANSTGGSKVFHLVDEEYIQIKVPGSSDTNPTLSDILVDTRLPYVPIIAEGTIVPGDFVPTTENARLGNEKATITFDNPGNLFLPFVKYVIVNDDGYIYQPEAMLFWMFPRSGVHNKASGTSAICRINNDSVEFFTARDNPTVYYYDSFAGQYVIRYNSPFLTAKIRYYIYAIPVII